MTGFAGNMFLAGTYKAILDRISNDTLPKTSLHLSTKVTSIASQATGNDQYPTLPITVTTSDHESLGFDEVVMTAPLGYLKRNIDAFQPPLSPRLLTAIHNISYGALEKVYLTFPTAFWLCAKDQGTEQPFHNLWLAPDFTPHHYPVECVSLSSLPVPHAHPTLLFYMHGPLATHITSITSSLEPSAPEYLTILADFFRPYYSLLPFYSPTSHHCGPTHALATNWQNDEFAGYGSYSNFQISDPEKDGMVALDKDIEALREGMPERRLWLAGEHVAPFVALGTVTGAWLSGEKVARRILGEYGVHEKGFVGDMADVDVEEGKVASKRGGTAVGA
ncbi:MAG: hypothetical protein L6R40_002405 [Gallowayella cf. fulva]|nr:MAG: hypothetical protein L6R40_002405 [Xanthomendoza cf. fulva]